MSESLPGGSIDRSERPGRVSLVLLLAGLLVTVAAGVSFLSADRAQLVILVLLAVLAMIGVFFVFALAIGAVFFSGRAALHDVTRAIADGAGEGLLVVEDNGRIIYANERYLALARGESIAQLRTVERVFTGSADVSEAVYRLAQAARERRTASEEIRFAPGLGGGGEFGWYRILVRPLPRPDGRTASLWSVADVTAERQRQENVFQELQHAIDYLDHAPAGFFSIDPAGAVVYMNATLATWLGYDLASVGSGGLRLADIVPATMLNLLTAASGPPGEMQTETLDLDLRRRNQQSLPVRLYHRVGFDEEGRPTASRTLVINRSAGADVAEGQRAAEVRFARFFNATPVAIATLSRAGRVLRTNASFLRLFGSLRRSDSEGGGVVVTEAIAGADRAALIAALEHAASGRSDAPPLDLALAGERGRSARIWLSPVNDADNDGETAILYALDMTEQRQLEQQFAQAQKMDTIGQLAGGIAHDFNNVLQAIIGYSDLLLANHRPTDPSFQDIMQIKQNANRAASLVRQLLAFSRRQTLRPEIVDLGDALSDLSLLLRRLLGERVGLDLRQGRDLWSVKADVNQLEQVIVNLAVNARDAMPDGGTLTIATANVAQEEAGALALAGMPAADYVLIEVRDTGSGIPPEIKEKIFEPFFTTKEVGKGTGLGLSTVFGIVKQSGGFIYVDSTIGGGTTFRIYLPRHELAPEEAVAAKSEPAAKLPQPDMTGEGTILLVEDEDAVRAVNARALTARGYVVIQAASGVEALEAMEGHAGPIDLVVSDVVMPEMDGPTLLGELRRRHSSLKVVFVSGYAEEAFRRNLPEGEVFNFLAKPFSLKQLVETVKQAIAS